MSVDAGYTYATGDLLENPNTYSYTVFGGASFLQDYIDQRKKLLSSLPAGLPAPFPENRILPLIVDDVLETDQLLESVFYNIMDLGVGEPNLRFWLEKLIKKFEVTKRLHKQYGNNFLAIDRSEHKNYGLYVRFAEILDVGYSTSKDLRMLSTLLKCVDTICSFVNSLDISTQARVVTVITHELSYVDELCRQKGVSP